jgi:ribulose-bisphosphate carboxylase small chain
MSSSTPPRIPAAWESAMRVTQGTFSYLPALTDVQVRRQIARALGRHWSVAIEHTADPAPATVTWETWGGPVLDATDVAAVMDEVKACRAALPDRHVRVVAFDGAREWETVRLAISVQRPRAGRALVLVRHAEEHRVRYALRLARSAEERAS